MNPSNSAADSSSLANTKLKAAVLVVLVPALFFINCSVWYLRLPRAVEGQLSDFDAFYGAGYMVRSGHAAQLYDHDAEQPVLGPLIPYHRVSVFIHPAYEAWFFVPLSWLPFRSAYFAFLALNSLLLVSAFLLLMPSRQALPIALIFALSFAPFSFALLNGQDSLMMLFLLALAWRLLKRNFSAAAGVVTALCLFRFQLAIPIALLFLIWRRWRFVTGFFITGATLLLASLLTTGLQASVQYVRLLMSTAANRTPDFMISLRGFFMELGGTSLSLWKVVGIAVVSGLLLVWIVRHAPRTAWQGLEWAVPLSLLIAWHVYLYDASLAALSMLPALTSGRRTWPAWLLFVALGVGFFSSKTALLVVPCLILFTLSQEDASAEPRHHELSLLAES